MNTRLQQFISAENITQSQFADSIGVARASISHILSGRNKPGFDFISNVMEAYPELNIEWLIAGKGKMYRTASDIARTTETPHQEKVAPVEKQPEKIPFQDDDDLLFHDVETVQPTRPTPTPDVALAKDIVPAPQQNSRGSRKAVKVIVFYNDNTFQEF